MRLETRLREFRQANGLDQAGLDDLEGGGGETPGRRGGGVPPPVFVGFGTMFSGCRSVKILPENLATRPEVRTFGGSKTSENKHSKTKI